MHQHLRHGADMVVNALNTWPVKATTAISHLSPYSVTTLHAFYHFTVIFRTLMVASECTRSTDPSCAILVPDVGVDTYGNQGRFKYITTRFSSPFLIPPPIQCCLLLTHRASSTMSTATLLSIPRELTDEIYAYTLLENGYHYNLTTNKLQSHDNGPIDLALM